MNNYEENSPSIHILTNVSKSRPVVSLKIYDQDDQSGTNACDPSPCQHLCLPKPQMDYTCHCTLGYILENEIECKEDTKSDKVCNIQTQITPKVRFSYECSDHLSHSKNFTSLFPLTFLSKHISLYALGRLRERS